MDDKLFFIDLYSEMHKLAIEVDGPSHDGKKEADRSRDRILKQALGITTLRFTNEEVMDHTEQTIRQIVGLIGEVNS